MSLKNVDFAIAYFDDILIKRDSREQLSEYINEV